MGASKLRAPLLQRAARSTIAQWTALALSVGGRRGLMRVRRAIRHATTSLGCARSSHKEYHVPGTCQVSRYLASRAPHGHPVQPASSPPCQRCGPPRHRNVPVVSMIHCIVAEYVGGARAAAREGEQRGLPVELPVGVVSDRCLQPAVLLSAPLLYFK